MAGILYLTATPIGNLEDMTFRAVRILKEVDLIAAEDTRNSIKLLNYFEIKTPMTSYHEYNKFDKGEYLVRELLAGKNIALISDAGTPGISDPGEELVKMCIRDGITVSPIPGACAGINALIISGMSTRRFSFEGFLPSNKKEKQRILENLKEEKRSIILYEAPHRLLRTLKELYDILGDRNITICRELTKKYETADQTTVAKAMKRYEEIPAKGECVIVIEGKSFEQAELEKQQEWERMTIKEHVDYYILQGKDKKDAMKLVAKDRGISKRDVYQEINIDKQA